MATEPLYELTATSQPRTGTSRPLRRQELDLGVASLRGGRDTNEDSVRIGLPIEREHWEPALLPYVEDHAPRLWGEKGMIALVADGMGGMAGGQSASEMGVREAERHYFESAEPTVRLDLEQTVSAAAREVHYLALRSAQPQDQLPGTTLLAAVILGERLLVANVGDSRAYLISGDKIRQITQDHVATAGGRQAGLTRSLGEEPQVRADYFEETLQPGDAVLLCTDGLTKQLSDPEILAISAKKPAQAVADALAAEADRRGRRKTGGHHDNISVVVIRRHPAREPVLGVSRPLRILAVLALVLAALLAAWLLWPRSQPPPGDPGAGTPSGVQVAGTRASQATATQTTVPQTTVPQDTNRVVVTLASDPTATPSPTPPSYRATTTPAPRASPTPTIEPASTLAPQPDPTDASGPTTTSRPTNTAGAVATPGPGGVAARPQWLEPAAGTTLSERAISFRWAWAGDLGDNLYFQVRIRTEDEMDAPAWGLELWRSTTQNISIEPAVRLAGIQNGQTVWLSVAVGHRDGSSQALAQPVLAESDLRAMFWNPPSSPAPSPEPTEQGKRHDDSTN